LQAGWQKWIPLTGVLFVILYIVGFGLVSGPDNTDSDQKILDWYNDSGHQTSVIIGAYLLAGAVVAMLLFMNRLRAVISEAEGARPIFAPFILAGGAVFATGLVICGAAVAAVPAEIKFGDAPSVTNADVARFLPSIGYGTLLVLGMFPLIFAMFTTAYASMRYKIFAAWFNWLSIVCGTVLFFSALFFPQIALGVWMLAGCWVLMKHQPGGTST
jgi:MFS family permease